jgi:hypothetical protein
VVFIYRNKCCYEKFYQKYYPFFTGLGRTSLSVAGVGFCSGTLAGAALSFALTGAGPLKELGFPAVSCSLVSTGGAAGAVFSVVVCKTGPDTWGGFAVAVCWAKAVRLKKIPIVAAVILITVFFILLFLIIVYCFTKR